MLAKGKAKAKAKGKGQKGAGFPYTIAHSGRLSRRPVGEGWDRSRCILRLTARGASPAAFDARGIPGDCVATRSNTASILARRALSAGRRTRLGATRDLHHGLLSRDGVMQGHRGADVHELRATTFDTVGQGISRVDDDAVAGAETAEDSASRPLCCPISTSWGWPRRSAFVDRPSSRRGRGARRHLQHVVARQTTMRTSTR